MDRLEGSEQGWLLNSKAGFRSHPTRPQPLRRLEQRILEYQGGRLATRCPADAGHLEQRLAQAQEIPGQRVLEKAGENISQMSDEKATEPEEMLELARTYAGKLRFSESLHWYRTYLCHSRSVAEVQSEMHSLTAADSKSLRSR